MRYRLASVSLVILFVVALLSVPAQAASIGFVRYQFSSDKIYQGDSDLYVDLEVTNIANTSIVLHGASVHFDWQEPTQSFIEGSQTGGEAWDLGKTLGPGEVYTFRISFRVPSDVSEGAHYFYFKVFYNDGSEDMWNPRSQDPFANLEISSMYEPSYEALLTVVEEKLLQAEGAGLFSPEATSLLQRAQGYLDDAYSYAAQDKWQSAFSRLQSTSSMVDQAYAAEQRFRMYLVVGVAIALGAVVVVGLFYRRRKKRTSKSADREAVKAPK